MTQCANPDLDQLLQVIEDEIKLRLGSEELDPNASFFDLGVSSIEVLGITERLSRQFEIELDPAVLWEHSTLSTLGDYLRVTYGGGDQGEATAHHEVAAGGDEADAEASYDSYSYDMFLQSAGPQIGEIERFHAWVGHAVETGVYPFEAARDSAQKTEVHLERENGERLSMLNLSSYNYLGFGYHPEVIDAAKGALDRFGLGAASSPVMSGTYSIHKDLERRLVKFFGLSGRGVSLFSSGYAVNVGAIEAFVKPKDFAILDQSAHMSILEGARLSGARLLFFRHNDVEHLAQLLDEIDPRSHRTLICLEGIYSGEGDAGRVREITRLAKDTGAYTLVDEAHSVLIAGEHGRGVAEAQGALEDVDLYVMTFSKSFGAVGGALLAREEIVRYTNWFARGRMFSCALDPAATGGILKVLELAVSEEGAARRHRIEANAGYLRSRLRPHLDIGVSTSWIIPVVFGNDAIALQVEDQLQRRGLDTSLLAFPAVPRGEARIRLFVTSEHTREQLDRAADILVSVADDFGFLRDATTEN